MGEAKRRQARGGAVSDIKIPPRKRAAGLLLAHHGRVEKQDDDGMVYAQNAFRVMTADGQTLMEETPDGLKPVLLMSTPQPVRRAVLALVR
jgi:hypothetical protein